MSLDLVRIPIDLHCHSINSDGSHTVEEVLDLVVKNSGKYIALTDHDTVDGVVAAREYGAKLGLNVIAGVEISVTWNNSLVHIVGLNIDTTNANLIKSLTGLRQLRFARGEKISANLAKIGIKNALEGAMSYCSNPLGLSRTHFAKFLVANGYATQSKVFNKYLVQGKIGYVPQIWATLEDAVSWITSSGGIALIAHPCRYKFNPTKLANLIADFKKYGGEGIEVISSSHTKLEIDSIAKIAKQWDLFGSLGSDFHDINANNPNICVGINYKLPHGVKPIYHKLGITQFD